jgi:hypothetical protein
MLKLVSWPVFVLALTLSIPSIAQQRIYVNEYLNIGIGGRGLAMGGAVAATAGEVTAGYGNPAGLMRVTRVVPVWLMHGEELDGASV